MENSKIEWTNHTFNPWIGCTKVSPGCLHCYAETLMDSRYGRVKWGKGQPRSRTAPENWKKPLKWNRDAEGAAKRPRVFCASLADWLDDEVPIEWLADLLDLIQRTPNIDWLLLSKRPENWYRRVSLASCEMAESWIDCLDMPERGAIPENVWIGTTVENQKSADDRITALAEIPARFRFLSCEPLLGKVSLYAGLKTCGAWPSKYNHWKDAPASEVKWSRQGLVGAGWKPSIDWVIAGGESGPDARAMHPDWARTLRDQCEAASVPFLFKQWGEHDEHMVFVGKKAAGRQLDGVTHDAFPVANVMCQTARQPG